MKKILQYYLNGFIPSLWFSSINLFTILFLLIVINFISNVLLLQILL